MQNILSLYYSTDQEPEEGISESRLQALTKGNSENDHD